MLGRRKEDKKPVAEEQLLKSLREMVDKVYAGEDWSRRVKNMNRWQKEYTGEWWKKTELKDQDSQAFINLIFSTIQTKAPLLTDNRPVWFIRARQPHFQNYLNVYRDALEYVWDVNELDRKVHEWSIDCQKWYLGLMKVYYDPETEEVCHELVDPREFVFSPGYEDLWDVAWCGEIKLKPLSWVKETYPEKFKYVKEYTEENKNREPSVEKFNEFQLEEKFCKVYEIWMRSRKTEEYIIEETDEEGQKKKVTKRKKSYPNGRILTFTPDVLLDDRPSPFRHGMPPYVPLYDYVDPHSIWGIGEAQNTEDINKELNLRLQDLSWHARKHARLNYTLDEASGLDPEKVKKEMPEGDNVWTANHSMSTDPIKPIEPPRPNPIHEMLVNILMKAHEEVSGVTDVSKGMTTKKEKQTASEMSILIESSYTRTRQGVRNLEWSIKRLCYLTVHLMQQFYTQPHDFTFRKDETMNYGTISNSKNSLLATVQKPPTPINLNQEQLAKRQQEQADYDKLIEYLAGLGEKDDVFAEFDIEIQTNSTLPMDRQSLANLALRLFELKALDREALFDVLNFPKGEEIAQRMNQKEQALIQAKMSGGGPGMMAPPQQAQGRTPLPIRPVRVSQ